MTSTGDQHRGPAQATSIALLDSAGEQKKVILENTAERQGSEELSFNGGFEAGERSVIYQAQSNNINNFKITTSQIPGTVQQ